MIAPHTLLQGRYLVESVIGRGGMGAVYMATDQRMHCAVAVKETFFADESLRKAFEREACLLANLRHAALPKVSDHFVEESGQFLVMEFIEGADLSELMQRRRGAAFPASEVLRWADELLDALDYLHTHEPPIVHRDIKPQNLKLTARGRIVLLDFGLAKGTAGQMTRVSVDGSVAGYTLAYASQEQVRGLGTDARSDLYSLAATLYHLMTGVLPPSAMDRMGDIATGEPDQLRPASEVSPYVPDSVAALLMRAMSLKRDLRPTTAAEMRQALAEAGRAAGLTSGGARKVLPASSSAPAESHANLPPTALSSTLVDNTTAESPHLPAEEAAPYQRRLPTYLLVDCSAEMVGEPIEAMRQGLLALVADLRSDPQALETACISVITFNDGARQECPLTDMMNFRVPELQARGGRDLGAALKLLEEAIRTEVRPPTLTQKGDWKALVFVSIAGRPTDEWEERAAQLTQNKLAGNIIVFAAGPGAETGVLRQYFRTVVELNNMQPDTLKAFFKWVSSSVGIN